MPGSHIPISPFHSLVRDIRYWSIRSSPEELGGSYRLGATGYISQHGYQESHVVYGVLPSMYIYWHGLSLRASDLSTSSTLSQHLHTRPHIHAFCALPLSNNSYQVSARFCDSLISLLLPLVVAAKDDEGLSFL